MKNITISSSRRRPDRRVVWLLVLIALLLGLMGVCGVSWLVLRLLTPYGTIYPHSLLAMYSADYRHWNPSDLIALPPLNPQAASAAEHDLSDTGAPDPSRLSGVVPAAILPPAPADILLAALQPNPTPTAETPTATSDQATPTPDAATPTVLDSSRLSSATALPASSTPVDMSTSLPSAAPATADA